MKRPAGHEFCVLGDLEVRRAGTPLEVGGRRARQRAVLGCLLVHAGEIVSTDRLIDALWAERPPGSAKTLIHGHVARLRQLLEPERRRGEEGVLLVTTPSGYVLRAEAGAVDARVFEDLLAQGGEALEAGRYDEAARLLREALGLWRGRAFGDMADEPWATVEAGRLNELRVACLEDRIEADLHLGRHGDLIGELEALIAAEPLRERLRGQLMRALYGAGRQADALAAYQEARRVLVDELGLEPSRELRDLEAAILRQDESLMFKPRARPAGPNLPLVPNRFLGRKNELAAVVERLGRDDVRLLTLSGPGGIGKTRLALEAARVASEAFEDDVTWVPLAGLREPGRVLMAIGQALGLREEDGPQPDSIARALAGRRALMVLDNAEHLLPAFATELAGTVAVAPSATWLVTSRQRLRLAEEHVYPVPVLEEVDGVALFLERALANGVELEPDSVVVELCRRLDRLPLALELAAARTPLLAPEQLLVRLGQRLDLLEAGRNADPRQQTLRATIEWSYELLDEPEQRFFAEVSVFAGGCTYEAAERVCGADPKTLQSLIDKSLLQRRVSDLGSRYWMLETIREYASEKRAARSDEGDVTARFVDEFLALAEEVPFGFRSLPWLRRVAAEHDNIRAALAVEPPREHHLRLVSALVDYWFWSGHVSEGRSAVARFLDDVHSASEATRARSQCVLGFLAMLQDDFVDAEQSLDSGAVVVEQRAMNAERVLVLMCRAIILLHRGELERADRLLEDAMRVAQDPEVAYVRARILRLLSVIAFRRGDHQKGSELRQECLIAARGTDDVVGELILGDIAWQTVAEGDFKRARQLAEDVLASQDTSDRCDPTLQHTLALALLGLDDAVEADDVARSALRRAWARRDPQVCAMLIDALSASAAAREDDVRAARLAAAAERLLGDVGVSDTELLVARSVYGRSLEIARDRAGSAWTVERARGAALDWDEAVELALGFSLPPLRPSAPTESRPE